MKKITPSGTRTFCTSNPLGRIDEEMISPTGSGSMATSSIAVLSFIVDGVHPHDVGTLLNQDGVAVRTGHHCAQPVMQRFKVPATSRASFAFYNTMAEVDALVAGIRNVQKVFA